MKRVFEKMCTLYGACVFLSYVLVCVWSKFLKKHAVVKKVNDTNTMVKKKLKVRVPSKFLKKAVKKKVKVSSKVFKKNLVKLRKKKKVAKESECPTSQKKSSSTLSAVKRLVRLKRKAKVHPITSTK